MHQARKYSPTRLIAVDSPLIAQALVNRSPMWSGASISDEQGFVQQGETLDEMLPPPSARIRISSKGAVVKAVRKHAPPLSPSLESLEAAWGDGGHPKIKSEVTAETSPTPAGRRGDPEASPAEDGMGGQEGVPQRSRKKGFRAPDVRTIFSERDPRVKEERGEGHRFLPGVPGSWCDVCCQYIFQDSWTCAGCRYTCHTPCREKVSLDCQSGGPYRLSTFSQDQFNNNNPDVERERESRMHLSWEEIWQKVELYNSLTKDHLKMTLSPSGVYTGFIKVQMELRRPVTVRAGRGGGGGGTGGEAFFLPAGATNTLHISSHNTVRQVIVALLNKFTVADNPAKYALFKRYRREEQVYVCKLAEGEQPLFLRLAAGPNCDTLSFVLREQNTGEVMWDAFTVPELSNFLRILKKEEQEQVEAVTRRYDNYRQRLQEAMLAVTGPS